MDSRRQELQNDVEDIFAELEASNTIDVQKKADEERALDMERLLEVWTAERAIDELLPYEGELMQRMLQRVQEQSEYLTIASEDSVIDDTTTKLIQVVIETELERVRGLLASYTRTRLRKLERYGIHILRDDNEIVKLAPFEEDYMRRHLELLSQLLHDDYLSKCPESMGGLDDPQMVTSPNLDHPVFVVCKTDCDVVLDPSKVGVDEDAILELSRNNIYAIKYSLVKELIAKDYLIVI